MARRHAWVSGSGRTDGLARREVFVLLAVAAWSGTTACQGGDPAGAAPGDVPTATAHLELRIDGYEADLVPITWMGVGPDGTMALIQWQDRNVRFFGPDGTPLGTVGGPGAGPGEFERPVRGGWVADTLWIRPKGASSTRSWSGPTSRGPASRYRSTVAAAAERANFPELRRAIERDEMGVESVVRYRIDPPTPDTGRDS